MATDISLSLSSRGLSWTGKLYESQLVALAKGPLARLKQLVDDLRQQVESDNPTLSAGELEEALGRLFLEETFFGGKGSLPFLKSLEIVYPKNLIDQLVHSCTEDGVVWKLDSKEYGELVDSFMSSTKEITDSVVSDNEEKAEPPVVKKTQGFEKKAKTKKADSAEPKPEPVTESVAVVVDPDVEVQLRAEELRSQRLEELRREMASLSVPEPKLVDLEVV